MIENKAAKAKYLSKSLIELWERADAHTPKGDVGPVDFDPVTNSQEPDIRTFKVAAEKLEADKATVAVTITGHRARKTPADQVVRYDFVRESPAGRSTTSGVRAMASPGRSVPCSEIPEDLMGPHTG